MPKHWKMYFTKSRTNRLQVFWFFSLLFFFCCCNLLRISIPSSHCDGALEHSHTISDLSCVNWCKMKQKERKISNSSQGMIMRSVTLISCHHHPLEKVWKYWISVCNEIKRKHIQLKLPHLHLYVECPMTHIRHNRLSEEAVDLCFFNMCIRHERPNTSRESPSPHTQFQWDSKIKG